MDQGETRNLGFGTTLRTAKGRPWHLAWGGARLSEGVQIPEFCHKGAQGGRSRLIHGRFEKVSESRAGLREGIFPQRQLLKTEEVMATSDVKTETQNCKECEKQ